MLMGFYSSEDPSSAGGRDQYFPIKHCTTLLEVICEARVCDGTWYVEQVRDHGGRARVGREA